MPPYEKHPYEVHPLLAEALVELACAPTIKERLDRRIRELAAGELPPPGRDQVDHDCLLHLFFFAEGGLWHVFKLWIDDQSKPGVWRFNAARYNTRPRLERPGVSKP